MADLLTPLIERVESIEKLVHELAAFQAAKDGLVSTNQSTAAVVDSKPFTTQPE